MDLGYEVVFAVTGAVLVLLMLILLVRVIRLEGKIVEHLGGSANEAAAPQAAPAPRPAPVQAAPAVAVGQGVPGEVVAAMMAAITAMSDGKYTLKAVRRGYNGWARAGLNETTAPF